MEKDCNAKVQMPDLSGIEFIGEIKEVPAWEMGVKITICVSIELVAIVGNLLIIIIIAQSPKMRNVTNYYILNLAISDLLVGLFAIWIHLVDDLTQGWVLGSFLCKFNPFMQSKRRNMEYVCLFVLLLLKLSNAICQNSVLCTSVFNYDNFLGNVKYMCVNNILCIKVPVFVLLYY